MVDKDGKYHNWNGSALVGTNEPRSVWKAGTVILVNPGTDGLVQALTVLRRKGTIQRPIGMVCPLTPLKRLLKAGDPTYGGVMEGEMDKRLLTTLDDSALCGLPDKKPVEQKRARE
eukprot:TCALIF_06226-PA protein Name:"Protein of unknown function" AED:0.55 eAED:0.64 QI:0/-1/0/1/-1/1/1/0/115